MTARVWRGWAAVESLDEIAAHLHDVTLARYAAAPGNLSATVLCRPSAGGVEVMTMTVWDSEDAVPREADERHPLLVARQTVPSVWQVVPRPATAVARAA